MEQINMLDQVVSGLEARLGDLRKVANDTGLTYDTVLRIKNRENDPAFSRVALLHAYLFPESNVKPTARDRRARDIEAAGIDGLKLVSRRTGKRG